MRRALLSTLLLLGCMPPAASIGRPDRDDTEVSTSSTTSSAEASGEEASTGSTIDVDSDEASTASPTAVDSSEVSSGVGSLDTSTSGLDDSGSSEDVTSTGSHGQSQE